MSGDLKERIEAMLAGLGDTADAVADSLRAKGITGTRAWGSSCPVANLLRTELEEADCGEWDDEPGQWWVATGYVRTPEGNVPAPGPVATFIAVFDDGEDIGVEPGTHVVFPFSDLEERAER